MHQSIKKTLPEQVMEKLENEIITGRYAIGGKIPPEPELVQYFKVSRNSVREAVQSLIHAGILEARQGSGTYVIATSRFKIELAKLYDKCETKEINELRAVLGKFIAKTAHKRINSNESKNLEEKAAQLKDCIINIVHAREANRIDNNIVKNTDDDPLQKSPAKKTKKYLALSPPMLSTGASSTILANISLLRALDHEFTVALAQSTHNNVIMPLFVCLQKKYLTQQVEENEDTWIKTIKLYGKLANAIKKKDAKAIKKLVGILYS